ncbi:MAG: hypothetical protein LM600_07515, partial [Thaumarchaeota archaeon]|nr:hypothetical protein [Nitrososphaerota archaeon]
VVNAVVPGQSITFGILYPLIVGVLPTLLGTLGGGLVTALAGAVRAGVAAMLGGAAGRVAQAAGAVASAAPSGVARLSAPRATPTPAQAEVAPGVKAIVVPVKPGPIITPATVKSAVQEARMKEAIAEALAEAREVGPGITFTLQGPEAYRKHAEELAKEPEIHPKWEAFKAGLSTLAKHAARRAWTNIRALVTETKESLKYQIEKQFGVRLAPSGARGTRIGWSDTHSEWIKW